ncbi:MULTISPECIES: tRNA pseudouridine(55) synthase TruB [unclassified Novosphingobium]|uniref:tRNA pseudouridine(55) synthase TruB n=1 Tax=unclassified Novosphingobium TaxID=2644732 RepID=UPI00146BDC05|nr:MULTISPECIES: tRNA pseudouridine(55) synthase TruB [unclassified Novosphingobium]NMN06494.1 tRNA pseudouridine55 synthase [Novosphingobium sp. SG919]NMN89058.1 tRNA pseudouridine55 synthase [Novosphingobium sp. SG916]
MADGWIILDKPLTLGSTQGVAAVKRNARTRGLGKAKVGHGGTLDPLATGVLPIALGEATKLCGRMLDASKTYAFTVAFGAETDTLDLEGAVIGESPVRPARAALDVALATFTGPIVQVPPAYSALKVDGQRAYDLARAGETVELAARNVTIHALRVLETTGRADALDSATLEADVSKGTYVRSLARDLALALGTRGHVTMLRRLKAGPFTLDQAISLDKLNEWGQGAPLENVILPVEAGLVDIPALDLNPEQAGAVRQGRVLSGLPFPDGLWWARCGGKPVALVMLAGGALRVERGFNL